MEMKMLSNTFCKLEFLSRGKDISRKTLFDLTGKAPVRTANKPWGCQTPGNRLLSHAIHLKDAPNPNWTCTAEVTCR